MNEFQGGANASQLSPQNFKNSSQTGSLQQPLNSAELRQSQNTQNINQLNQSRQITVVGSPQPEPVITKSNNESSLLVLLVLAAVISLYFVVKLWPTKTNS